MTSNFATQADLAGYLGSGAAVPEVDPLNFRFASLLVRQATRRAVYRTHPVTLLPLDPQVAEAMRSAVCAQVLAWAKLGIDPTAGSAGLRGNVASYSMGGVSKSFAVSVSADDSRASLADGRTLSRLAALELTDAGLTNGPVQSGTPRRGAYHEPEEVQPTPGDDTWDPSLPDPSLAFENGLQ